MTPQLRNNLCLSALAYASDEPLSMLEMLGQGDPCKPLDTLFDKHPAKLFQVEPTAPENAVEVLNFVVRFSMVDARISHDKVADLCSFFIQRIKFMEPIQ